jgi:hypothetical protein
MATESGNKEKRYCSRGSGTFLYYFKKVQENSRNAGKRSKREWAYDRRTDAHGRKDGHGR